MLRRARTARRRVVVSPPARHHRVIAVGHLLLLLLLLLLVARDRHRSRVDVRAAAAHPMPLGEYGGFVSASAAAMRAARDTLGAAWRIRWIDLFAQPRHTAVADCHAAAGRLPTSRDE